MVYGIPWVVATIMWYVAYVVHSNPVVATGVALTLYGIVLGMIGHAEDIQLR